ncbi:MAG: outer membrane beta-barrel protein [Alphaproteobacteria bacterium]|nr:outer membrane beta-barrel protein [Alphaproteobacteria bacterium]
MAHPKTILIATGFLLAATGVSPVLAEDAHTYMAGRLVTGFSSGNDIEVTNGPQVDLVDDELETTIAAEIALGRKFDLAGLDFAAELQYRYRHHLDLEVQNRTVNVIYDTSVLMNHTVMANIAYFIPFTDSVSLRLDAGVGFNIAVTEADRRDIGDTFRDEQESTATDFAFQLGAGVDIPLTERWTIEAFYRYSDLGRAEVTGFTDGTELSYGDVISHEIVVGGRYRF